MLCGNTSSQNSLSARMQLLSLDRWGMERPQAVLRKFHTFYTMLALKALNCRRAESPLTLRTPDLWNSCVTMINFHKAYQKTLQFSRDVNSARLVPC